MGNSTAGDEFTVRVSGTDRHEGVAQRWDSRVIEVGPTGRPDLEPLGAVTADGRTAFYPEASPEGLAEVVSECRAASAVDAGDPLALVDHGPNQHSLPLPATMPGTSGVTGGCGWRRPTSVDDHEDAGGFVEPGREGLLAAGESLAGRGWTDVAQDEPVAGYWEQTLAADGEPVVVVNGHARVDRLLLESAPFEALDGANALARAVDANRIVVYTAESDEQAGETVRTAAEGFPAPAAPFEVVAGSDAYRAGEPTMAIEDIEGNHRLEARRRPPGPETFGIDGRPTLVHSPRTLARLAVGLRDSLPETRVVTFEGDISAPATLELAETETLENALGAVSLTDGLKAASVGGRFGGLTDSLAVRPDHESLAAAGLGTDGLVHVLGEGRCILEFIGKRAAFAADANCGRCVPCREGTTQLAELLRDIYEAEFDPEKIEELTDTMAATSICEFGVAAGRPARTALETFEGEIEAHAGGRCPAGTCLDATEART